MPNPPIRPVYPTFPARRGEVFDPRMRPMPTGPLPPLPRVPMWNPTTQTPAASSDPGGGPDMGSPEDPTGPATASASMPQSQGQLPPSWKQRLQDPRLAAFLMSVGGAMGAPPQVGQTGWGRAAQAMGQGYSTIAMMNELQRQRDQQAFENQIKVNQEARANATTEGGLAVQKKAGEQGDKRIGLEEKQIGQQQSQFEATMAQRSDQFTKELDLRKSMSADQLAQDRAKLDATIKQSQAELAQRQQEGKDRNAIAAAQLKISNAELAIRANEAATHAMSAAAGARLSDAQTESIKAGTGRYGTTTGAGSGNRDATAMQGIIGKLYTDPLQVDKTPEGLRAAAEAIYDASHGLGTQVPPSDGQNTKTVMKKKGESLAPGEIGPPPDGASQKGKSVVVPPEVLARPDVRGMKVGQPLKMPDGTIVYKQADGSFR